MEIVAESAGTVEAEDEDCFYDVCSQITAENAQQGLLMTYLLYFEPSTINEVLNKWCKSLDLSKIS